MSDISAAPKYGPNLVIDPTKESGYGQGAISATGIFRSLSSVLEGLDVLSYVIRVLGTLEMNVSVEVSNASEGEVTAGTDDWLPYPDVFSDEDVLSEQTIAPAQRTPDVDDLEFVLFEDEEPDLEAVAATTGPLPDCTASGTGPGKTLTAVANGALVVDGITPLDDGDEGGPQFVLVNKQVDPKDNGLYEMTENGDESTQWVLTRSADFDQAAECVTGTTIEVTDGETQQGIYTLAMPAIGIRLRPGFNRARLRYQVTAGEGTVKANDMMKLG